MYGDRKMNEEQAPRALLRLALFQPEIPGNTGAVMRLCACLGLGLDIIEPCGFLWDDKKMNRSAMDYKELVQPLRHKDWESFLAMSRGNSEKRVILMTTKADTLLYDYAFQPGDILLAGSESSGAPSFVHDSVDARIKIPLQGDARSLNLGTACAIVASEAIRQILH